MKFRPELMATSLVRLPHRDVEDACRVMIRNFPEATPVPYLTRGERMWLERMPCLKIDKEKKELSFQLSGRENELVEFYDRYLAGDLDYFAISPELEPPLYKLAEMYKEKPWPGLKYIHFEVPGIYSWGITIKDENGVPIIYNDTLRDMAVKLFTMKGKWRERKIKELFPGVQTLITIANGGLGIYSTDAGTGSWEDIKNLYNEQMEPLEGITSVHCCANFDWSLLMEINTDVINFDAYQYGETMSLYPDALKKFLGRGGMIAWGIVPTAGAGDITTESPGTLVERLERLIELVADRGIDKELLLESSWITPTCVPSTLSIELAERVLAYTREVSQRMREKYFG